MTRTISLTMFAMLLAAVTMTTAARGDGMIFSYEGDILPGTGSDWVIADACELDCSRRLEAGHFILEWGVMGNLVNYDHTIAGPGDPPPHALGGVAVPFQPAQAADLLDLRRATEG